MLDMGWLLCRDCSGQIQQTLRFLYRESLYTESLTNAQSYKSYQLEAAAFITS